jgi:hypothetical protein
MDKRLADVNAFLEAGRIYRASGFVRFIGHQAHYRDCLIEVIDHLGPHTLEVHFHGPEPGELGDDDWLVGIESFDTLERA